MTPGPVLFDLQTLQSPQLPERAVARYAYELAVALEQGHPQLVGRYLLNPDLPAPGDLGPLVSEGKVGYLDPSDPVAAEARVLHVISPFDPAVPMGRIWPRWAHERGLRLCATVCDPIPARRDGEPLDDLRERTRHSTGLEVLRAADALLTTSVATSRSLEENLRIEPARLHTVGSGTERLFVPPRSREHAFLSAQASVPNLEPSFVLCPALGDGTRQRRGADRRLRPPACPIAQLPSACRVRTHPCAGRRPSQGCGGRRRRRATSPVHGSCADRSHAPALPGGRARVLPLALARIQPGRGRSDGVRRCRDRRGRRRREGTVLSRGSLRSGQPGGHQRLHRTRTVRRGVPRGGA